MQVRIAFVTGPDGQVDASRVGTIEEHPDAEAKELIKQGIAAEATELELADWAVEQGRRDEARTAELSELKKAELLEQVPDGVEVPTGAAKGDLVAAIIEAEHAPPTRADEVEGSKAPIVTAAPGSMAGENAGPGETDGAEAGSDTGGTTRTGRRTR